MSLCAPHPVRRVSAFAALLVLLHLLIATSTAQADPSVVFVTTQTFALASNLDALRTACAAVQANATALISPATDSFAKLADATAAAGVDYAYVSATMDTANANMWLWRRGGDVTSWDSIVTSGKWAPTYPVNTSAEPYAAYSTALGALVNMDGVTAYPIACMYDYYVEPEVEPSKKKKDFPWWAILIIVLGSVVIIAVVVVIVVCCCCCKKTKKYTDDEDESSFGSRSGSFSSRGTSHSGSSYTGTGTSSSTFSSRGSSYSGTSKSSGVTGSSGSSSTGSSVTGSSASSRTSGSRTDASSTHSGSSSECTSSTASSTSGRYSRTTR